MITDILNIVGMIIVVVLFVWFIYWLKTMQMKDREEYDKQIVRDVLEEQKKKE